MRPDNQLFVSADDLGCIVQCTCGAGHWHGQLEMRIDLGYKQEEEEEEDFKWYLASVNWVQLVQPPVYGKPVLKRFYKLGNLLARTSVAWDVLRGRPFDHDFEMSAETCKALAGWLTRAGERFDAIPEVSEYYKGLRRPTRGAVKDADQSGSEKLESTSTRRGTSDV